jgi:hypothetical protein
MQGKKYTLSSGKEIYVFDDMLPLQSRDYLYDFLSKSKYVLGWMDGNTQEARNHSFLHSNYSDEDNANAGLLEFYKTSEIAELIAGLSVVKSVVNLSVASDVHFVHAHPEKLVVLYYANLVWEPHWYGETVFFSEDLKNIELALPYTPGRIIAFDASIPHAIRPQSIAAEKHRFTYTMVFD